MCECARDGRARIDERRTRVGFVNGDGCCEDGSVGGRGDVCDDVGVIIVVVVD